MLAAVFTVAGCNQASSPATVHDDVAKARDSAAEKDAKADQKMAGAAYDTAVTEAEGAHKVALARCESLSGNARSACKDQADAALESAKANAKAEKANHN